MQGQLASLTATMTADASQFVGSRLELLEVASIGFALVAAARIDGALHLVLEQLALLTATMTADASRFVRSRHALLEVASIRLALVAAARIDRASHLVGGHLA